MECFNDFNIKNFSNVQDFFVFQLFPAPGALGPLARFDNEEWRCGAGMVINSFYDSSFSNFWIKTFFKFAENFHVLRGMDLNFIGSNRDTG